MYCCRIYEKLWVLISDFKMLGSLAVVPAISFLSYPEPNSARWVLWPQRLRFPVWLWEQVHCGSQCVLFSFSGQEHWRTGARTPARGVFAVLAATSVGWVLECSLPGLCSLLFLTRSYFVTLDSGSASHLAFPRLLLSYNELVGHTFKGIHVLGRG